MKRLFLAVGIGLQAWLGVGLWAADAAAGALLTESRPLDAAAGLASVRVPAGFRVELMAAEPLVVDPVAFDWGPDGRLWVVEMRDYPNGLTWRQSGDPLDQPGGRVKVLADTNGDGRYDTATLFLDDLPYPTGIKVWGAGVLITAAPDLFYAEDSTGDGRADRREVWYSGFARSNQQHRVNGLAWGLDNWLHVANGDGGGVIVAEESRAEVDIRGFDLRIHPVSKQHEPLMGRTQCGRFRDDWDNWFGCNNSNPLWHYPYAWHHLKRNPLVTVARAMVDVPMEPGAAPVYPISPAMERFNDFHRANRFTSACGPTIYRDQVLGEAFLGNAFTCEPVHNLVSRQILRAAGASFRSERHADEVESEFFASTDPWSRPVSVRTGPDGGLWVADMYRLVIEHPEWIPQDWQKRLALRAGEDRGRIYRVVPEGVEGLEIPRIDQLDDEALMAQLHSSNGTLRDLVHQMLLWRQAGSVAPGLRQMAVTAPRATARVHAICVLDGLGELDEDTLRRVLEDAEPGVLRHAVRLARGRLNVDDLPRAESLLGNAMVAREMAGFLGGGDAEKEAVLLAELLSRHASDPQLQPSLLSAVGAENLPPLVGLLTGENPQWRANDVLPALGRMAAQWKLEPVVADLLLYALRETEGESRQRLPLLTSLLQQPAAGPILAAETARLQRIIKGSRRLLHEPTAEAGELAAAVRFLGHPRVLDSATDFQALLDLLKARTAPAVREAVLEVLQQAGQAETAQQVLERWAMLSPGDRQKTLALLLTRKDWTKELLLALREKRLPRAEMDIHTRKRLLEHEDDRLRTLAAELFDAASNPDREQVLAEHGDVLQLTGDAAAGRVVFVGACAACHAAEGVGNAIGPELAALTDRSAQAMLIAILDPNRAVEDKYLNYTVTTTSGDSLFALIEDESANSIRFRLADGSLRELGRGDIAGMSSTGVSFMPEGFEKLLSKQQLADVMTYLAELKSESPPGPQPNVDMAARVGPGRNGVIELRASRCRLDGEKIQYMEAEDAIGWWISERDRAQWTVVLDRPGRYRVEWEYSVAEYAAGNRWQLEVGGKSLLSGEVRSTGGWEQFEIQTLGEVDLPAADNLLVLRSEGPVRKALLDLRWIRFTPVP